MKKNIGLILAFILMFSSTAFGIDSNETIEYLKKQDLDEWGILALYSCGEDIKGNSLEKIDSNINTDYEAYVLGAISLGKDVSREAEIIKNSQMSNGKFADFIDGTGEDLINSHIWGIISLYVAGEDGFEKEKALKWLKENQNEDGGFPVYTEDSYSDLDMTAMGVVAYKVLGLNKDSQEVEKAIDFIEENLSKRESCESIGWNMLARVSVGLEVDKELYDKLLEYRLADGSFKHIKAGSKGNYIATYHGLLALADYENKISIFDTLHNINKKIKFKDIKESDYAYKEIMSLVNQGVVSGYPDGTFRPNNEVKRAEFAKFLIYGLGIENEISYPTYEFKDLKEHWANKTVALAVKKKLIKGGGNGKFAPENKITGAEVATMLIRAKGLEEKAKIINSKKWYEGYVEIAKENDLLYDDFAPEEYATRAECAVAIFKLQNK